MHFSGSMKGLSDSTGLAMFSKMTFDMGNQNGHAGGITMVVERGNVKWLGGASADALFTVPVGFTQAQ